MPWYNGVKEAGRAFELERADNGVFETAQTGVEYISPNQRGGIYGTVYIQFFSGTLGTGGGTASFVGTPQDLATIATSLVMLSCQWTVNTGGAYRNGGWGSSATSWVSVPRYNDADGTIKAPHGSAQNEDTFVGEIEYTK